MGERGAIRRRDCKERDSSGVGFVAGMYWRQGRANRRCG